MNSYLNPPLVPRNGHTLRVLLPSRVSDPRPGKQNEKRSLGDQRDIQDRWLAAHTELPLDIKVIAGKGSGEILDREEYLQLLELIQSEEYDLVLTEDLGRIVRRVYAFMVCELCEDHGVRLIAVNNHNVDTAVPGWRDAAFFASYFYEKDNSDKSLRITQRLQSRVMDGGAIPSLIFGIIKLDGTKHDSELRKDPDAEEIYKEWFRMLDEDKATYQQIADWLNSKNVPVGPSCWKKTEWDGPLVAETTHNWLLKGIRYRNKRKTRRVNKSGKYVSEPAPPEELLIRRVPHLAFFEEAYYDRVVEAADERNAIYRRGGSTGKDPLKNVPRKQTRFPGQSVHCGVCGRLFVFGGHGQTDRLMCTGAREHKCWNGVTFDGPEASQRFADQVYSRLEALPAFEPEFLAMLQEEIDQLDGRRTRELKELDSSLRKNSSELARIVAALRKRESSGVLLDELDRLERQQRDLSFRYRQLENAPTKSVTIPPIEEVRNLAREECNRLAEGSNEFARFMRKLLPEIHVFPFRLCDGGKVVLRASATLTATSLIPNEATVLDGLRERLTTQLRVDLFDSPQREAFREQVVRMRSQGSTECDVASELDITKTAAQYAAALQRMMDAQGLADAWLPLREPPSDDGKLRRHLHDRYRFEPLDGYPLIWPE